MLHLAGNQCRFGSFEHVFFLESQVIRPQQISKDMASVTKMESDLLLNFLRAHCAGSGSDSHNLLLSFNLFKIANFSDKLQLSEARRIFGKSPESNTGFLHNATLTSVKFREACSIVPRAHKCSISDLYQVFFYHI